MNTIIGKKIEQTQKFLENGTRIPVTVIAVSDNPVVAIKSTEKDGYDSLQIGFGNTKKANKALIGHVKKAGFEVAPKVLREVRLTEASSLNTGDYVKVEEVFAPGDIISVTGTSKGKGFAGGVKRHGFKGGPRTHGQSDRERAPGSIGQTTTPGRVYKGKRMAGRMGTERSTVQNLLVVDVNPETKIMLVKGLVPGILGGMVTVTKTGEVKEKNFVPLHKIEEEKPAEEVQAEVKVEEVAETTESEAQADVEEVTEVKEEAPVEEAKKEVTPAEETKEEETK